MICAMDEQDINIKNLLSQIDDESVPFGFETKVFDKIEKRAIQIESRRETIKNIVIAMVTAAALFASLFCINQYFFKIDFSSNINFSFFTKALNSISSVFKTEGSFTWIILGANIAILLICERVISEKISKKRSDKN